MRDSILTEDDIGNISHARSLKVGATQIMSFQENDLPPIFHPDAPKYDQIVTTEDVTRKFTKKVLQEMLNARNINSDGLVEDLRKRAEEAIIPISETSGKVIEGYVGKPKGALQIACEREFCDLSGNDENGIKLTLHGASRKDPITDVVTVDKTSSVIRILGRCKDFKTEKTQLMYIMDLLSIRLILTPKCHPEIAGRGIEYAWGYSKLRFRCDFNDAIAMHLKANVEKSLDKSVLTLNRIRKFARKAREYKLTYALIIHLGKGELATAGKDQIEHITKLFKAHRSAMDADYSFINNA